MAFKQPDFSARRQQINQQVNAELLEYVDSAILSEAAVALEAAQDTIKTGQATHEDLMKIAEATSVANKVLLAATKMVTVAAVESGSPEDELARAVGVTKNTVQRWTVNEVEVPLPLGDVWWEPVARATGQEVESPEEDLAQSPTVSNDGAADTPLSESDSHSPNS